MLVVVVGNPFDGMAVFGPFHSDQDAIQFAAELNDDWHIVEIESP